MGLDNLKAVLNAHSSASSLIADIDAGKELSEHNDTI
jgi:hypothetical protein